MEIKFFVFRFSSSSSGSNKSRFISKDSDAKVIPKSLNPFEDDYDSSKNPFNDGDDADLNNPFREDLDCDKNLNHFA